MSGTEYRLELERLRAENARLSSTCEAAAQNLEYLAESLRAVGYTNAAVFLVANARGLRHAPGERKGAAP